MPRADAPVRPRHAVFAFRGIELAGRRIALRYALTGGPDLDIEFEESLVLPDQIPAPVPGDPQLAVLLDGIHRVFGVSYFKAAVPTSIDAAPGSERDAQFWDLLYTQGLSEFYFRNELTPIATPAFPRSPELPVRQGSPLRTSRGGSRPERVLTLVGGGKDSMLAREIVRHAGVETHALALGRAVWIERSAAAMATPLITVERILDPKLAQLNARGAWNGHVPISACIAFVAELVAYLGDYRAIVAGNERSADEGNTDWRGLRVNHQWSKSLEFEREFQAWCARALDEAPAYFSLLRPLSEIQIAAEFSRYPQYFEQFASCNANYKLSAARPAERWCGKCPKCVFVQLIFAPFLTEPALTTMFGRRFIDDAANLSLIAELTGIRGIKPFECVGTVHESTFALASLAQQGRLGAGLRDFYAEHFGDRAGSLLEQADSLLEPIPSPCMPVAWRERLHAYLRHP